jgi:hypothetical protein
MAGRWRALAHARGGSGSGFIGGEHVGELLHGKAFLGHEAMGMAATSTCARVAGGRGRTGGRRRGCLADEGERGVWQGEAFREAW